MLSAGNNKNLKTKTKMRGINMEVISNIVLYIMSGLLGLTIVVSLTFYFLPQEKLGTYKDVVISVVQRTPEVKVEVNQQYKTK